MNCLDATQGEWTTTRSGITQGNDAIELPSWDVENGLAALSTDTDVDADLIHHSQCIRIRAFGVGSRAEDPPALASYDPR